MSHPPETHPPGPAPGVLGFHAGGRALALPVSAVEAVRPDQPAEPVPLAPPPILGLVVDRGRVLTVIDLEPGPYPGAGSPAGAARALATYLITLAAPWSHLALRVRSEPSLVHAAAQALEPLDLERLVRGLEAPPRER